MSLGHSLNHSYQFIVLIKVTVIFVVQHFSMMYSKILNGLKNSTVIIITVMVIIIQVTHGGGHFN